MTEEVKFKDWQALDLLVGEIKSVERVEGTDKLYKMEVDLGDKNQTVVSGLVPYYTEDQLKGKKIILFCNLEARTIKGIESKGMVLAAVTYDKDGKEVECKLLEPDGKIENGAKVC